MTESKIAAALAAVLLALLLGGCGDSGDTVGVIQSINDDQTIGICDGDGLRTYKVPAGLRSANDAQIAQFAQSGAPFEFAIDPDTDSENYPTLSALSFDSADITIPNACQ